MNRANGTDTPDQNGHTTANKYRKGGSEVKIASISAAASKADTYESDVTTKAQSSEDAADVPLEEIVAKTDASGRPLPDLWKKRCVWICRVWPLLSLLSSNIGGVPRA